MFGESTRFLQGDDSELIVRFIYLFFSCACSIMKCFVLDGSFSAFHVSKGTNGAVNIGLLVNILTFACRE
jgi:hypothetical protein